jgi:predicted dehydrogenase
MSTVGTLSRRNLLGGAVAAAAPLFVPASALGRGGATAPSDRITMAAIGNGPRGMYVLGHFLKENDVRFVAACDCFADRRAAAKTAIDQHYGDTACQTYSFHEQVLERKDVDAVLIATGDRWHAVLSVLAARAGKDIYCEKPISLTIAEGRAMADTMRRYGTVWQAGTQRKSIPGYAFVREVVRSGRIGKLRTITASYGDGGWRRQLCPAAEPEPDPEVFDYNRWLGQAPWAPYSKARVANWRLNWDTSGGVVVDMGPHYCDFAQWVHGSELSGPVEYEGEAVWREDHGLNNVPYLMNVRARYADGVELLMDAKPKGVRFDGEDGWILLVDEGAVSAFPDSLLKGLTPPEGNWKIMAPHIRNFLDCVRTRKQTVSPPEIAQRSHAVVHCALISLRLGRKLRWDPETELFIGDDEADNMLARTMRAPWRI